MKYTITTKEDNSIKSVRRIKPVKTENKKNGKLIGYTRKYDLQDNSEEITKEQYDKLIKNNNLPYCKWINSELMEEGLEDKETRLKKQEEYALKVKEESEKEELISLIKKLQPYIKLSNEGEDLLNE